jgi:hypothetical protein
MKQAGVRGNARFRSRAVIHGAITIAPNGYFIGLPFRRTASPREYRNSETIPGDAPLGGATARAPKLW